MVHDTGGLFTDLELIRDILNGETGDPCSHERIRCQQIGTEEIRLAFFTVIGVAEVKSWMVQQDVCDLVHQSETLPHVWGLSVEVNHTFHTIGRFYGCSVSVFGGAELGDVLWQPVLMYYDADSEDGCDLPGVERIGQLVVLDEVRR